jgi:hypothetical protein
VVHEVQKELWLEICSELDLYGSNWPPQLARILLVMADHAERVTDHVQDDTTMVQDVAAWLRYEARLAMESELHYTHRHHRDTP